MLRNLALLGRSLSKSRIFPISPYMDIGISKEQQKVFVEEFMKKVLHLSNELVDKGTDKGSPGETIKFVGDAVINEIIRMGQNQTPPAEELN